MQINMNKKSLSTKALTKIGICVALLCVSSYISIPLPFSLAPITAQTIIINLLAIILLPKEAFFAVFAYILLGACGLPVFSGGTSGIGRILGPTGGYLVGYLIAAVVISYLKGKENCFRRYVLVTVFVGIPIIYICGLVSMGIYLQKDIITMITVSILPFLPGDLLKCIAGSYLGFELNKRIK